MAKKKTDKPINAELDLQEFVYITQKIMNDTRSISSHHAMVTQDLMEVVVLIWSLLEKSGIPNTQDITVQHVQRALAKTMQNFQELVGLDAQLTDETTSFFKSRTGDKKPNSTKH